MTTTSAPPHLASAAVVLVLALGTTRAASAQDVTYNGSIQVASGTYLFETRTTSLYLLSGIELTTGPLRLGASLPLIVQNTPWIAYGPVPVPSGGRQAAEVGRQTRQGRRRIALPTVVSDTHSGVGDPLLHAQVALVRDARSRPSLRVGASAKAPVSSAEDGFGTGAWDYGAGLLVSKQFGVHLVSADLFWRHLGDLDELPLENAWSWTAAYGRLIASDRWSLQFSAAGLPV